LEVERERVVRRFVFFYAFHRRRREGVFRYFFDPVLYLFGTVPNRLESVFVPFWLIFNACGSRKRISRDERDRTFFSFHEPRRPGVGVSAGAARIEGGGVGIGAVDAGRVGSDKPALQVPEHPAGDSPEDRANGTGRERPAGVGKIRFSHLPVDAVTAAGAEAAEGQVGGAIGAIFQVFREPTRVFVGERDIDLRGTTDEFTGFGGQFGGEAGAVGIASEGRRREASHGSFPTPRAEPVWRAGSWGGWLIGSGGPAEF
jgi:hypothetical protein